MYLVVSILYLLLGLLFLLSFCYFVALDNPFLYIYLSSFFNNAYLPVYF